MNFLGSYRKRFLLFLMICVAATLFSYIRAIAIVPGTLTLLEGQEYVYNFKSPFLVSIKADKEGVIKLNNGELKASGSFVRLSSPISLKTQKNGSVKLNFKAFGFIPFRTMQVNVVPNKKVIACGNTVGVKLRIDGILVIGISDVDTVDGTKALPSRETGIKPGDLLIEMNGKVLTDIDGLIEMLDKSQGEVVSVKYKRGNHLVNTHIKPVKSIDDQKYHIGLWVRDNTAGIGTLTFYDPETRCFGALGHGITDIDTGTLMPVESGDILESNILAIKKGKPGNPGELKGVFVEDRNKLGTINNNSHQGIYGVLSSEAGERISGKSYPIALRSQIKEGPATILSNIDGKAVEEFKIEIQKVSRQNLTSSKGMVLKITDKRLLDETGGIVQGMSGSPIIQDGRIVGAVTHVLVNDPTRGYGIFIENMLKNVVSQDSKSLGRAS